MSMRKAQLPVPELQQFSQCLLEAYDVTQRFVTVDGVVDVLRGVTLSVAAGEWLAITGDGQVGKSTLLNVLAGLDRPATGRVYIAGLEITHMRERQLASLRQQTMSLVQQKPVLYPRMTVQEQVELPLLAKRTVRNRAEQVRAMLDVLGLSERPHCYPEQLAPSEQQAVTLARALVTRPPLVMMDDPTCMLDEPGRVRLMKLLQMLQQYRGTTLVIATSDQRLVECSQRVVLLKGGCVIGV